MLINNTLCTTLKSILSDIEYIKEKSDEFGTRLENLGKTAIELIDKNLNIDPNNFDLRCVKIKLNSDWLFNDYEQVIKDANFIIDNDIFKTEKLIAHDWLYKAYIGHYKLYKKEIELVVNHILDLHKVSQINNELKINKAKLLYRLAKAHCRNNNLSHAYELLQSSYESFPYLDARNLNLGLNLLIHKEYDQAEIYLWQHFLSKKNNDDNKNCIAYSKQLIKLYKKGELVKNPNLIALMYHVILKHKINFGCILNNDFNTKYGTNLKNDILTFPKNSKIAAAVANMYFDLKDYQTAFEYYKQFLNGDDPYFQSYVQNIYKCTQHSNANFLELTTLLQPKVKQTKDLISFYFHAEDLLEVYNENQQPQILYAAQDFVAYMYNNINQFLLKNIGDNYSNLPNFYEQTCLIYGKALTLLAKKTQNIDVKNELLERANQIHLNGFIFSKSYKNLEYVVKNAIINNDLDTCLINGNAIFLEDSDNFTIHHFNILYCLSLANFKKKDIQEMKTLYLKAKNKYLNNQTKDTEIFEVFLNQAYDYFNLCIEEDFDLSAILIELKWICNLPSTVKVHKDIYGALMYYKSLCEIKDSQIEKAKNTLSVAITNLKEEQDQEFYELYIKAINTFNSL